MGVFGFRRGTVLLACAAAVLLGTPVQDAPAAPLPVPAVGAGPAPPPSPLRILPLGASSTVGAGSEATAGYRGPLRELLVAGGIAVDLVGSQRSGPPSVPDRDHEGHGGATLARLAPFVTGWVRRARPDVVLLHAGTNDLLHGVPAEVAVQRLRTVLDAVYAASDAHVVVAGVWAPLPGRARERAAFARRTGDVVMAYRLLGHPISYVDTSTLLAPDDFVDGLHADAGGYRRIAAMWEREIRSLVRR